MEDPGLSLPERRAHRFDSSLPPIKHTDTLWSSSLLILLLSSHCLRYRPRGVMPVRRSCILSCTSVTIPSRPNSFTPHHSPEIPQQSLKPSSTASPSHYGPQLPFRNTQNPPRKAKRNRKRVSGEIRNTLSHQ